MRKFPSKADRPALERDLETSAFSTVKTYDKGQRKWLFFRELHPVENVYQRLCRQQGEALAIPRSDLYSLYLLLGQSMACLHLFAS
jgi:hypothetical protein